MGKGEPVEIEVGVTIVEMVGIEGDCEIAGEFAGIEVVALRAVVVGISSFNLGCGGAVGVTCTTVEAMLVVLVVKDGRGE